MCQILSVLMQACQSYTANDKVGRFLGHGVVQREWYKKVLMKVISVTDCII